MRLSESERRAVTITPSGQSLSFGELDDQSRQFVAVLRWLGVVAGSRVAFLLGNQIEYPALLLGARMGGYDHLPLNTHADVDDQLLILTQFAPSAVVVSEAFAPQAEMLAGALATEIHWIMIGGTPPSGWWSYGELSRGNAVDEQIVPEAAPGKLLLLSGGSTGCPKIVERPHADAAETPRQSVALAHVPLSTESKVLVSAPLYHTGPIGWMLGALEVGAQVVIMERYDPLQQLVAIEQYGVTLLPVVPTMMTRLLELPAEIRDSFDLSSLAAVSHSAAPCSLELKQRFMEWIPQVWAGYSMTEGFGLCVISPEEWLRHPGSVGRPVSWCTITIRDEQGNELPANTIGTVWFSRHDDVRMRYIGDSEETARSYNGHGEGTAFDLGYLDGDGYLYLSGRSKNMIIAGGVNIYPSKIENVLMQHPAVVDACVVGRPDQDYGEVPVAAVQVSGDYKSPDSLPDELDAHCRGQLGRLSSPREIVLLPRLPRTETGKVRITEVAALIEESV